MKEGREGVGGVSVMKAYDAWTTSRCDNGLDDMMRRLPLLSIMVDE